MSLQARAQDVTVDDQFTSNLLLANQTSSDKSTFKVTSLMILLEEHLPWGTFLKFAKKAKEGDQIAIAKNQNVSSRRMAIVNPPLLLLKMVDSLRKAYTH